MTAIDMHRLFETIHFDFDIDELARAIATNKAVVYTGAGTSFPARLPGWVGFLKHCLERAKKPDRSNGWWDKATSLLEEGDYLTCAGLIQSNIGNSLEQYVWDAFGEASEPTEIHKAISRLPFSLAITTNYDRLLESAYPSRPNVWTWRDPEALFCSIKHRRFGVVKIHGDVGNGPSLVLTRNQYRDLMHLNKSFNDCLMTLLTLRSFLFVGSSLKDQDLIRLMDMAKLTFGSEFGPHYAISFSHDVDNSLADFLRDSYNLHCVTIDAPEGKEKERIEQYGVDWRTSSVCSFLKFLSGKVSQLTSSSLAAVRLENSLFSLRTATHELTNHVLQNTASDRCRIAFVKDPKLPALCLVASKSVKSKSLPGLLIDPFSEQTTAFKPSSFLGRFFRSFGFDAKQRYVADIDAYRKDLQYHEQQENDGIAGFSESRSLLAVPAMADSEKVGLVAIESLSVDAFTCDHLHGLESIGEAAGAIYLEYRHRQACADSIRGYLGDLDAFQSTMNMSRQLEHLSLLYILYEIDYAAGKLIARYSKTKFPNAVGDEFSYFFEEPSLATQVLHLQREVLVPDAQEDLLSLQPKLSRKGVERFKIEGSVYSTPIRYNGNIATILVCWSENKEVAKDKLAIACENKRIYSLATLLANSPEPTELDASMRRADQFVAELDRQLDPIDHGQNWTKKQMRSEDFQNKVIEVALRALTTEFCGLRRVRFWLRTNSPEYEFEIERSICSVHATLNKVEIWDQYKGVRTNESDPYCNYTIARAFEQPFTELQHMSMFGEEDSNWKTLRKCKNGKWFVAPIASDDEVYGFISADNHVEVNLDGQVTIIDERISGQVKEMQRCAVDVIVRLIENLVRLKLNKVKIKEKVADRKKGANPP